MLAAAPPRPPSPLLVTSHFSSSNHLPSFCPLPSPSRHFLPSFTSALLYLLSSSTSSSSSHTHHLFSLSAGLARQVVFNPAPVHTSFLSLSFEAVYLFFAPSQNNSSLLTSIRPASFPFLLAACLFFLSFLSGAERRAAHKGFY